MARSRDVVLRHASRIAAVSALPVSGDLANGFGDKPPVVAETIRAAAEAGLVGASIEDATLDPSAPIYEISFAAERIRSAVAAACASISVRADGARRKLPVGQTRFAVVGET